LLFRFTKRKERTMSKLKIGLVGAAALVAFAIPAAAMAQSSGDEALANEPTTTQGESVDVESPMPEAKTLVMCEDVEVVFDEQVKDLSADEIAEINADNELLANALREAGIDVTTETDELGVTYPKWSDADDEAAWAILDRFFDDKYGVLTSVKVVDLDDIDLEPADLAFLNEEADALAAHLDAAGFAYTVQTDDLGVRWIEWDFGDEAANEAAKQFFSERYGDFEECQLPQEVIDEINAEGRDLAQALSDAGIAVTMVAEGDGITYPEWAEADDVAAEAVLEQFFGERYGDWKEVEVDLDFGSLKFDDLSDGLGELEERLVESGSGVVRVTVGDEPNA
jgi:hypothetical protein